MLLEVIATNLADAIAADQGGADRIELVTGMLEGGLTPSLGLIERAAGSVSIPVNVMVRPHSLSFHYDKHDVQTMLTDIRHIRKTGARGIVIGALTQEGRVDVGLLQGLLAEAGELDVTFHRAFDEAADLAEALETLSEFPQISRVLTSGGTAPAPQAVNRIQELNRLASKTHLNILAGHGLTVDGIGAFVRETGVQEVHFGSAVREDGHALKPIDPKRIAMIRTNLNLSPVKK
ncbi:copper homeostasis protein CutC [Paenibacillus solisilvae]|uniref:PF03932 family protein CutC n=1 Tax=Paenibacillus solisilvae TaxID=2486751 RepID=A0ABW0VPT2_9BACL